MQLANSLHATVNFSEVNSYSGSKAEMKETLYFQNSKIATDPSFGKYCSQGGLVKWCWGFQMDRETDNCILEHFTLTFCEGTRTASLEGWLAVGVRLNR